MTQAKKLPGYEEALAMVLAAAPLLGDQRVSLADAPGRVLREAVRADRDQPPFDRSAMDGFAVRASEVNGRSGAWPVEGTVAAGSASFDQPLAPGTAKRIATGAPLPPHADAVIPIEQAAVERIDDSGAERVSFLSPTCKPWQNVHRRGIDARAGDVVIAAGTRLAAQHIGIAAAVGAGELLVAQRPRIVLITTGDEVRPFSTTGADLQPQQIRNSNGPMLGAMLGALGTPLYRHEHVVDEPEATLAAAREALAQAHVVVTVGGVSVGQRDHLPGAWHRLGLRTVLHGIAIQPGKPVFVATEGDKLVLGLPGNPVSVLATAHLLLWPLLRRMLAAADAPLPWRDAPLRDAVTPSSKRQVFRLAATQPDGSVAVIPWHGSGDLMHSTNADVLVRLPLSDEPVAPGTRLPVLPLAPCPF
jgi:molybdopterin molybdotransferase